MRMRKKKHGDDRLRLFSQLLFQEAMNQKINLSEYSSPNQPLCLEIGCGKGDFICELSSRNPQVNYVAVEKVPDVIVVALEKYAKKRNLGCLGANGGWNSDILSSVKYGEALDIPKELRGNVRFIQGDCQTIFSTFEDHSVDTLYLNFSDPWPKKGNAERRLTHPHFLENYRKILKPNGTLAFKSDNRSLYEFTVESLKEANYNIEFISEDLHNSPLAFENIETEYERNFSAKGFPIHCIIAHP